MKFLEKNITSIFISIIFLFFLIPVHQAQAAPFVCIGYDEDAGCRTIEAADIAQAKAQCVSRETVAKGNCYNNIATDSRDDRGCVNPEGGCTDISAPSTVQAAALCADIDPASRVINRKCPTYMRPTPEGQAVTLGCLKRSGFCSDSKYYDFESALAMCHGYDTLLSGLCPVQTGGTKFGCIKADESCVEVTASTEASAAEVCAYYHGYGSGRTRIDVAGCGVEKNYACFKKTGECEDIFGNLRTVTSKCKTFCPNGEEGCSVDAESDCAHSSRTPVSPPPDVETVAGLRQKASAILNVGGFTTPANFISRAINILMAFIGSITLVLYVLAGLLWMTASGNSEQADRAKRIMVWTTLGVAVMLFSYILVNFLFNSIPK